MSEPTTKPSWVDATRAGIALAGLLLLSYGAGLAYRPAGFIVPGVALMAAGIIGALRG